MDRGANSDLFFLPDEKFDFDVSLSPGSSTGEDIEDEVFVGPVGHKERCISVNVTTGIDSCCVRTSWSPLSGDQLDAICEEAQKVASQLQVSEPVQSESENIDPNCVNIQKNEFVQDSEAKLSMLCGPPPSVLSPIKRQTFCIQDSPLKELPPAIQNRILKAHSPKTSIGSKANRRLTGKLYPVPSRPTSVSSPVAGAKSQSRTSLRGRSAIGVGVVLPNRPTAPKAPQATTKNPTDKRRLQPPSKLSTSWRRSPTSSRNGSCEDLLSDSASVASDVSDCSLNSSSLGKRARAPPTKAQEVVPASREGVRTRSGVKPPSDSSRRKTSSSSSSVSSFNSSFSLSPANKGKLGSSQTSLSSVPLSKPAQTQKHRRSVAVQPLNPPLTAAGRRSLSVQPRKPSNPTPMRRPESPAQTSTHRGSRRTSTVPSVAKISTNKNKPQALVPPTPNGALRGSSSPDSSKMLKPKRLISAKSIDSLPALTPSGGSSGALQLKTRRPSALPTPLRTSRPSLLPQATPTSHVRPIRAPPTPNGASSSLTPTESQSPESAEIPLVQPFNLEEEEPQQLPPTPVKPDQSDSSSAPDVVCLGQSEPSKEPEPKQTMELINKTQPEVLLLDLPAPAPQPHEKLLIDLINTPDLIRTRTCPSAKELIDLSSPLIKWSPVEKKEAEATLINLSF